MADRVPEKVISGKASMWTRTGWPVEIRPRSISSILPSSSSESRSGISASTPPGLERGDDAGGGGFEACPLLFIAGGGGVHLFLFFGDALLGVGLVERGLRLE